MTLQVPVETRVTNLEELMAQLTRNVDRLSYEMREFKDEMREFKDEMHDQQVRTDQQLTSYQERSEENVRILRDETKHEIIQMRKQWGELSNRLGTMVEDLVAPSIGRILRTVVHCEEDQIDFVAVRVKQRRPSDNHQREFDAIAICGDYMLVNETKSRLRPEDISTFTQLLPEVRTYFPEHAGKKIIGAVASLYVDESLVRLGERLGLIVLGFGEDVMDVLNSSDFQPKVF